MREEWRGGGKEEETREGRSRRSAREVTLICDLLEFVSNKRLKGEIDLIRGNTYIVEQSGGVHMRCCVLRALLRVLCAAASLFETCAPKKEILRLSAG